MNSWHQSIRNRLLVEEQSTDSPIVTLFDACYLPTHRLLIHFVSIDAKKLTQLPSSYFASISNEAEQIGIRCVHVWEDVYQSHPNLVISRLLALIGKRKRIHARSTQVVRITKELCEPFLEQHHLQGYANAYYKYALMKGNWIVAVATFSKSRVMQDKVVPYRSYELIRFASLSGYTVAGGLGKLLSKFIADVHPAHLMTYADRDWGNGSGYQKLGFTAGPISEPLLFYVDPQTMQRKLVRSLDSPPDSWIPVYNSGNIKYLLDYRDHTS